MSEPKPFIQPPETPAEVPATPPVATPTTPSQPAPKRTWYKTIGFVLLALVMVPYYAFQIMEKRVADAALVLDPQVAVKLHVGSERLATIIYLDGTWIPSDGHGLAALTWADFQSQKDRFSDEMTKFVEADFPVVVFFNSSGFDSTGDPVVVRRAKDGSLLYTTKTRSVGHTWYCIPQRDGSFLTLNVDGKQATVSEQEWYERYMGLPLQPTPADPATKPADPLPAPPAVEKSVLQPLKGGLSGRAIRPTLRDIEPLAGATLVFFAGPVKPADSVKTKPVATTIVAKDGQYSISLAPGIYTVAVVIDGKIYGNAQDQSTWPTVEVKDIVVAYDVRFTQGLSIP